MLEIQNTQLVHCADGGRLQRPPSGRFGLRTALLEIDRSAATDMLASDERAQRGK